MTSRASGVSISGPDEAEEGILHSERAEESTVQSLFVLINTPISSAFTPSHLMRLLMPRASILKRSSLLPPTRCHASISPPFAFSFLSGGTDRTTSSLLIRENVRLNMALERFTRFSLLRHEYLRLETFSSGINSTTAFIISASVPLKPYIACFGSPTHTEPFLAHSFILRNRASWTGLVSWNSSTIAIESLSLISSLNLELFSNNSSVLHSWSTKSTSPSFSLYS